MSNDDTVKDPEDLESAAEAADMEKSAAEVFEGLPEDDDEDRLEDKRKLPEEAGDDEPDEEEADEVTTARTSRNQWSPEPSVPQQHLLHPTTVRHVGLHTLDLVLSDKEDLKTYNALQAKASDPESPRVEFVEIKKEFYEGKWYALLTYSELEYQKI